MSDNKVGAVLIVGSGISGMQAALDLAESGIKVYLLDNKPSIGGKMVQLDKTFPTNDCAMCTIAPRLVDIGKHPNIKLITYAELEEVKGDVGNFDVKIKVLPRYVDIEKCVGCGVCEKVCPRRTDSEFEMGLGKKGMAHIPFPQAVPMVPVIDKREERPCKAACKDACPIRMNVPGYISLIKEGKFKEAYELIRRTNPLPAVCGRVCYAPCEDACNRGQLDEPLASRALKRFVTEQIDINSLEVPQISKNGEKAAIIGSGPAGLAAAHDLALLGYEVTIFEALPEPGGMLRYGIPEYRLSKDMLRKEIGYIEKLGVKIKANVKIGDGIKLEELRKDYQAIFIATGAHESLKLNFPGGDSPGVIHAIEFLRKVNMRERVDVGGKVAVIGGGNTAIDASRVAKRLGADVKIIYRRSRAEMPATAEEVKAAEEEGIEIMFLANPTGIITENGRVSKIECIRMELGESDGSGRLRPIPIKGSEFIIDVDTVITAIGQASNLEFIKEVGLEVSRRNTIAIDKATLATNIEGIFAGGDVVTGPAVVIDAIAAGKKAARSIDEYLKGKPFTSKEDMRVPQKLSEEKVNTLKERFPSRNRVKAKEQEPLVRTSGFEEVEKVYSIYEAQMEAGRCMASQIEGCIGCGECEERCEANAIDFNQQEKIIELKVGSIILSPGFELFDPSVKPDLGFGHYPNVVSSLQFERLLSPSGPTAGKIFRPSDQKEPERIAFIQCVGSRDYERDYCSAVCCMYATKEAIIAREHIGEGLQCDIFYMDIRAFGKGFEEYYQRAKTHGVNYIRCRIPSIKEISETKNLIIEYLGKDDKKFSREYDLVVLSAGLTPPKQAKELAGKFGLTLNRYGFCETETFNPVNSPKEGIFVAGAFTGPKDIPESVIQGSAAASKALSLLSTERGKLVKKKEYPPEKDIKDQEPRIGVFICHCGKNIGGVINVPEVVEYAKTLPNVVRAQDSLYVCSADFGENIKKMIKEHNLNRVVVASCTPRTHEPLFQSTIREAGLNPYLFEMANIRDQCTWVHMNQPGEALKKAKDLVRVAVAKSRLLEPLYPRFVEIVHKALVIGGGLAGMTASLELAEQGFDTYLLEKNDTLGGNLRRTKFLLNGENPQEKLKALIEKVRKHPKVHIYTDAQFLNIEGSVGNFKTQFKSKEDTHEIKHGIVIVATGAQEYKPTEYLYGQNPKVITQMELEEVLTNGGFDAKTIVMIQCVGSRNETRPYCSRICCSHAVKNALKIKEKNPDANVYILYRDMRTYGFNEAYYTKAREKDIRFIMYEDNKNPEVRQVKGQLKISLHDPILNAGININSDLLVLSSATVPGDGNKDLARKLKVPLTADGFFLEAHMKLRPVDFATDGIFLAGLCHYPKHLEEVIAQAQAAAARAGGILSKEYLTGEGIISCVNESLCRGCGLCKETCVFGAIELIERAPGILISNVKEGLCKGCGACTVICPTGAMRLRHYTDDQVLVMVESALKSVAAEI